MIKNQRTFGTYTSHNASNTLPGKTDSVLHELSRLDIACTKLITASARGSKKDFIDIYFLLKEYSLPTLFEKLALKYVNSDYNEAHILKSLVYFTDADEQPMPRMHQEVSWEKVKEEIIKTAKDFRI